MVGVTHEFSPSISEEKFAWTYDMDQCSTTSSPIPTQATQGFRPINVTKPFYARELSKPSSPFIVDLTNDATDDSDDDGNRNGHDNDVEEGSQAGAPSVTGNTLSEVHFTKDSSPTRQHVDSLLVTNTSILDDKQSGAYVEDIGELRRMIDSMHERLLSLERRERGAPSKNSNQLPQPRPKRIKRAGRRRPRPYSITDLDTQDIELSIQAERIIISRCSEIVEYTWEHPRRRGEKSSKRQWKAVLPEGREMVHGRTLLARMDVVICVRVKQEWPPIRLSWNKKAELYEGEVTEGKRLCVQMNVMLALVGDVEGAHMGFLVDETY